MVTLSCCESFAHLRLIPNTFSASPVQKKMFFCLFKVFSWFLLIVFVALVFFSGVSLVVGFQTGQSREAGKCSEKRGGCGVRKAKV